MPERDDDTTLLIASSEGAAGSIETELIRAACEGRGIRSREVIWDAITDPAAPVLVRHTWDYHKRIGAFRSWLASLRGAGAHVANSVSLIEWNLDKRYLRDLREGGMTIPRTAYVERGERMPGAGDLAEALGTSRVVVKPTIAATSWRTRLVELADRDDLERAVEDAAVGGHAMIQEFLPEIARGEWSIVYLGGRFSHAVEKLPAEGEFRVQTDFGGSVRLAAPPEPVRAEADRCLSLLPEMPVFARVDGVASERGFILMELELIEPDLFLRLQPGAAERLVDLVVQGASA